MPAPPTCDCIAGLPLPDQLTAIYCVIYAAITNPVDLPDCQCIGGLPQANKMNAIYCALLQFTQQPFSGTIEPSQISGITPFGVSVITASPGGSLLLSTDGGGLMNTTAQADLQIQVDQLSNATTFGKQLLLLNAGQLSDKVVIADSGGNAAIAPLTGAGLGLIGSLMTPGADAVVLINSGNAAVTIAGATNTVGTPTAVTVDRGVTVTIT